MDIVRFRPGDRDDLQRFLDVGFPDSHRADPRFWDWVFRTNPDGAGGGEIWLLKHAGRIVGQLPTVRTNVQLGGRVRPARVTFDFLLLPEYRNRGAGPLMVRALAGDDAAVLLNLGPNRAAFPIFAKMGWKHAEVLPRAIAVLDPGVALARWGLPESATGVIGAAGRAVCGLLSEPPRRAPAGRVEVCGRFGPDFDAFWAAWSSRFDACFQRDHRRMNWRFADFPFHKYEIAFHRRGGVLTGYLVMRVADRKGVPTGLIVEHAGEPDAGEALLRHALRHFAELRVGVVHTRLPHPDWAGLYQRAGFFVRTTRSQVVRLMFRRTADIDPAVLGRPRTWFVTSGDGDADW